MYRPACENGIKLMTSATIWREALARIQGKVPKQVYDTWFMPICLEKIEDSTAQLGVPNKFFGEWLSQHYKPLLMEAISVARGGEETLITFTLSRKQPTGQPETDGSSVLTSRQATGARLKRGIQLNSKYTFENFVVGAGNQFAHAACMAVAEQPAKTYNPLFIYGETGLGKTHLLNAIGNYVAERTSLRIAYLTTEQFTNEVINSIRYDKMMDLRKRYRHIDMLMIDDIQFFSGKNRTQEEFFYAFEAMVAQRKQIIITSDTYPKELSGIDTRLISRFDSGLTVAIEPPELEMRVAILLRKAEQEGVTLPEDVAFFIAKHLRSNVRELEGALKKVVAYARFHGREVANVDICKDALKDLLSASSGQVTVENIQKTVADYYKMKVADMYSKRRPANIAMPRQVAMYLAKELTQKSLPEIGDLFGGRDHTTVLHAVRKITDLRAKQADFNHTLHVLEQTLKG